MTAIANARQTVPAPVRKPRRYGIFSVVTPHDGGDQFWMLGGLTSDGEECSIPKFGGAPPCGPSSQKEARSWYSDIDGDPWFTYMYETCKTVGRYSEVGPKLRERFLASEQSAVEQGIQQAVLAGAQSADGPGDTVPSAIGALEDMIAQDYGGQGILHLPMRAGTEAARFGLLRQVGDHLETWAGNLVVIGNYDDDLFGGTPGQNTCLYATGAMDLYRSDLVEVPPQYGFNNNENDYYALIERSYAVIVDCFVAVVNSGICSCTTTDGGGGPV